MSESMDKWIHVNKERQKMLIKKNVYERDGTMVDSCLLKS